MDLTIEQQKYVILKAVELKLVSANKLDPQTKGTGIARMKGNSNVSPSVINRRYKKLLEHVGQEAIEKLLKDYPDEKSIEKQVESEGVPTPPQPTTAQLRTLQMEIQTAQAKIEQLAAENQQLKEKLEKSHKETIKINGWSVVQRKAGGGDQRYWYAGKSIGGKMHWIYLGKELHLPTAKRKIESKAEDKTDSPT
jgi:hypothetical protein